MVNVTPEMFADGQAVAEKALNGDSMPPAALSPKPLAAGSATSLYAALDPELECKFFSRLLFFTITSYQFIF